MKILFYSYKDFERSYLQDANKRHYETASTQEPLSLKTVLNAKGFDVVSVFTGDDVSAPVVEQLYKNGVRYIAIRAVGYDNVDIIKANELSIKVANVPEYSPYAVAEHAVAMILALNRKLILADKQVHNNNFKVDNLIGFDLKGKKAGIIGTGRIGSVMAKILHGFGCNIIAYDISPNRYVAVNCEAVYTDLKTVCRQSDIITIHAPLTEETHYLLNKELIDIMKPGVMLINTSRGAIVKTSDVLDALKSDLIGSFGMDVYEKEKDVFFFDRTKFPPEDKMLEELMSFPNVLITPHQAFATKDA